MNEGSEPSAEEFEEHRDHLFGVAYRMLGSVTEAEDVVQEAFLRWDAAGGTGEEVRSARGFLTTVTTRLAIDHLRSARHRRETYVGPWLPEPLVTEDDPADSVELAESLTVAFLVLLEQLNPVERAVFILRDVFAYDYEEVAAAVGRSPGNCRQIAHRARGRLGSDRPPRYRPSAQEEQRVVQAFAAAAVGGDLGGLLGVLAEDVVLWSDGGRDRHAARRPVVGRERVSRFVANLGRRMPEEFDVTVVRANGEPTLVVAGPDGTFLTVGFDIGPQGIRAIHSVVNPDKLRHLGRTPG